MFDRVRWSYRANLDGAAPKGGRGEFEPVDGTKKVFMQPPVKGRTGTTIRSMR